VTRVQPCDECQILTLSGIDVRNAHAERRVVTPFEVVESCSPPPGFRAVAPRVWRRLCRALLAAERPGGALRVAGAAHINLLPYQLEPALTVLQGRGARVLLADEVGLGKTIQAGLILAELVAAHAVERALVLAPAGLRDQWACELGDRFSIRAVVVGAGALRQRASELLPGHNPWTTFPVAIASLDYVKRPDVLPGVAASRWDLIVVDEAHGVTEGSDRFHAVQALCRLAPYVVLVTATPHSGDPRAFHALCRLGSLAQIPGGRSPSPAPESPDRLLVFRRRRDEVGPGIRRRIHRLFVTLNEPESHVQSLLDGFTRMVRRDRGTLDDDVRLALAVLRKRALSSSCSLARTIERRLAHCAPETPFTQQLPLPLDDEGEMDAADEAPVLTVRLLDDLEAERQVLAALHAAALDAAVNESKIARLVRLLSRLRRFGEPAVVFTEYRDTLLSLQQLLPFTCAVLHGGLTAPERRAALAAFGQGLGALLLSTDAGGEGLNLQANCRTVVNFELPWNPNRLEQRIGRVDRIGQARTVHVFHFIARHTAEVGILSRLLTKVARARTDFDAADPLSSTRRGGSAAVGVAPHEPRDSANAAAWELVDVRTQAEAELVRLSRARCLTTPGDARVPTAPRTGQFVCVTRRSGLRRTLGSRILVIAQIGCDDGCGLTFASRVTAVLVTLDPSVRASRRGLGPAMVALRGAAAMLDQAGEPWAARARQQHAVFWTTYRSRQEDIARLLREAPAPAVQAGLFERRAERASAAERYDRSELQAAVARRIAVTTRLATAFDVHTGLTLVLAADAFFDR
jgi:superfamily II DNA or RNA helicase